MDLRKELIDFENWQQQQFIIPEEAEKTVDMYLEHKSINCALDEAQAVRQNEDAESNFICHHFESCSLTQNA